MTPTEITLYGTVGESWWGEAAFTASDVRQKLDGVTGDIVVRLNSGGGVATEGQAIYSILARHPGRVTVRIEGIAASAASLIAMAGDDIEMQDGAILMIHDPAQPWIEGRGTEDDHRRVAATLAVLSGAYAKVYALRAGITADEARAIMRAETYFDGEAAVAAGFATRVDETSAQQVAAFDYAVYAHAPQNLLDAGQGLARRAGKRAAVAALMAGVKPMTPRKETAMLPEKDDTMAADGEDTLPATEDETDGDDTMAADGEDTLPAAEGDDEDDVIARVTTIMTACENAGRPHLSKDMIKRRLTITAALDELAGLNKKGNPMSAKPGGPRTTILRDERDKFRNGAAMALMAKTGLGGERNEFSGMSLPELARHAVSMVDPRAARTADRMGMVGSAFTMTGGLTTSDFANVLSNVMGKAALKGWEEADETFERWTSTGTLTDFKPTKRVGVGIFDSLPEIGESGEYTYGTVGDHGEPITLATYGKMLRITRKAIMNDDLDILGKIPLRMGRAAKRTIGNLVYAVLTGNPLLSDGVALFAAGHSNLASPAAAIGVDSLAAGRKAMKLQKEGDTVLNLRPKYLIVPAALETAAEQLINSTVDPRDNKGHALNPIAGMAEIVTDARLDGASATAWYLAADQAVADTIEVAYLDGVQAPYLEEQNTWNIDGVEMKVRIDAAVAPLGYRGLYKNAGA